MSIVPNPFLRFARFSLASGFSSREKDSENDASREPAAAAAETEAAPVWLPIIERCASHDRCSKSFWAESSEEIQIHLTLAGFDEAKNKIYEVLWGQALKAERGVQFTPRELELLKTRVTPASLKYLNSVGVERDDYDEAERVFRIVDQRTRTSWCRLRAGLYPEEVSKQREKKNAAAAAAAVTKAAAAAAAASLSAAAGAADLSALSPPQDENGDGEVASEEVEPRGALAEIRKLLRAGASRDPEVRLASLFSLYGPPIFLPVSCVCCRAAPRPLTPPPLLVAFSNFSIRTIARRLWGYGLRSRTGDAARAGTSTSRSTSQKRSGREWAAEGKLAASAGRLRPQRCVSLSSSFAAA